MRQLESIDTDVIGLPSALRTYLPERVEKDNRAFVMTLSPEQMHSILTRLRPDVQRDLDRKNAKGILRQMRSGQFTVKPCQLMFDLDGFLINGQHILDAGIQYGFSITVGVYVHTPRYMLYHIDTGKGRSPKDLLRIFGHSDMPISTVAVMNALWHHSQTGELIGSTGSFKYPNELVSAYLDVPATKDTIKDNALWAAAGNGTLLRGRSSGGQADAHAAFLRMMFMRYNSAKGERFFDGFKYGTGLSIGDPELAARDAIIAFKSKRVHTHPDSFKKYATAVLVTAFKFRCAGKKAKIGDIHFRYDNPRDNDHTCRGLRFKDKMPTLDIPRNTFTVLVSEPAPTKPKQRFATKADRACRSVELDLDAINAFLG